MVVLVVGQERVVQGHDLGLEDWVVHSDAEVLKIAAVREVSGGETAAVLDPVVGG